MLVRPAAREDGGAAARGERCDLVDRHAGAEAVREAGGEAVAAAVRVLDRAGNRRGAEGAARPKPAAEPAGGRDDKARRRIELDRVRPLARVLSAPDERVELLAGAMERLELARGRDEDLRPARRVHGGDVAAGEVDRVAAGELLPGKGSVVTRRSQLRAEHGDRPLAIRVDVGERTALWPPRVHRMHGHTELGQPLLRAAAKLVVAERGEEVDGAVEIRELDGRDGAAAGGLLPDLGGRDDLARLGHPLDAGEDDPLHVSDDSDP